MMSVYENYIQKWSRKGNFIGIFGFTYLI